MPSGLAAQARAALQEIDREGLVPRRATGRSSTGFVNVIEIKGKFQARLQVPGDGRGGVKKRKQVPLPGLFDKAEDAALYLASFTKGFLDHGLSAAEAAEMLIPLDKKHKPRTPAQPAAAAPPLPQPVTTTVGMPMPMPMPCLPFVAASPVPMQSLGYFPPRF